MVESSTTFQVLGMSLALFWLRASIDRQKGFLVEAFAVTFPIALASSIIWFQTAEVTRALLGFRLTPIVVFIFLALPAVVGLRLMERLRQGEQPQLADMFRVTTITGMVTFVWQQLEIDSRAIFFVSTLAIAYLAGDLIVNSYPRWRRVTWLVIVGLVLIVTDVTVSNFYRLFAPSPSTPANLRPLLVMQLPVLLALLLMPGLLHYSVDKWGAFVQLGYWTEIARWRIVRPIDAIYHRCIFRLWKFRPGVCYLNHGSFGAVPIRVQRVQRRWQESCAEEPMDILARKTIPAWRESRDRVAYWLGSPPDRLALCENATDGMNEIAAWFPLAAGDEIVLTDHEYGAVKRIWQRRADKCGATVQYAVLPMPFDDPTSIVQTILNACTDRTRLVVFSHITSPTAVILPVAEICEQLRLRDIASCIDGPHAILQQRVHLHRLNCDFYTASCNKWLCAPLGSGLVYVHPRWSDQVQSMRLSWGLLPPDKPVDWIDELTWVGTRDYSPYFTVPAAIDFFAGFDYDRIDARNHRLALYARRVISELLGTDPVTPDSRQWMGWMAAVWLPEGDHQSLQQRLWERWKIEVPIVHFANRTLVRISCHLYNSTHDIDRLARALSRELS